MLQLSRKLLTLVAAVKKREKEYLHQVKGLQTPDLTS
jgi:hypothetical protein